MDRQQYFIEAMQAGAYKHRAWILSVFTVVREGPEIKRKKKKLDFPYQIIRLPDDDNLYFRDPKNNNELTLIDNSSKKNQLFNLKERIKLKPFDLQNVKEEVDTIYGNVLINAMLLVYPFGDKIPFITGKIKGSKLDSIVANLLTDYPEDPSQRKPDRIYVDEYLKYAKAAASLAGLAQLCAPAASEKTMVIDPAIIKRRDELLAEYKDRLNDPAILARIETELTAMDRASMKGDPAEGFFIKDKSYDVVRKRCFIMLGAEMGFNESKDGVEPIIKSLEEGMDLDNLPATINNLRSGSYSRGHETALGGESVKYFYRIFQNTTISEEDCGTNTGLIWHFKPDIAHRFVGLHLGGLGNGTEIVSPDVSRITEAKLKDLTGKVVMVRSPQTCKTPAPSYCARCMGDTMALNPTGVHISASDVGSIFLSSFMGAMHGKALRTAKFEITSDLI